MVLKVFAIRDVKAECYGVPFFLANSGLALRTFSDIAVDNKSRICAHPADYSLFEIGLYDDDSGKLKSIDPVYLGCASDYHNKAVAE